jgi:hypothetical protein
MVSSGSIIKSPGLGGFLFCTLQLKAPEEQVSSFLTVLGTGSPGSAHRHGQVLVRAQFSPCSKEITMHYHGEIVSPSSYVGILTLGA